MKLQSAYTKTIGFKDDAENRKVIVCRGIVREIPVLTHKDEDGISPFSPYLYSLLESKGK